MYQEEFVEIYDDFYSRYKDFGSEVEQTRSIVAAYCPHASSVLDVGCGTGEHLRWLRTWYDVVGLDASESMVRAARSKLDGLEVLEGDMRTFDAGRRFDVICSIYSCVGYLEDRAALVDALRNMRAHLHPGGVVLVEPWIFRENWNGGDTVGMSMEIDGRVISRAGRWHTEDDHSILEMQYVVADDAGVRHFVDHQRLVLLSRHEYLSAFAEAGLEAELLTSGFSGRGLIVATA